MSQSRTLPSPKPEANRLPSAEIVIEHTRDNPNMWGKINLPEYTSQTLISPDSAPDNTHFPFGENATQFTSD